MPGRSRARNREIGAVIFCEGNQAIASVSSEFGGGRWHGPVGRVGSKARGHVWPNGYKETRCAAGQRSNHRRRATTWPEWSKQSFGRSVMIHDPISALRSRAEMLQVAELLHRIGNDYTRAIAFASLRAANASSNEARSALNEVVNHLHAAAEMHRVLRPPSVAESADLTDTIARLCRAQSDVSEFGRRGIDLLLAYDDPIEFDAWRCWHASLIVAELINNACRHALGSTSGRISVSIAESDGRALCSVRNDGAVDKNWMPGLGTQVIDALALGLDGFIERRFSESEANAVLCFL